MQSPVDLSRPGPGSPTVMKIKQVIDDALEILSCRASRASGTRSGDSYMRMDATPACSSAAGRSSSPDRPPALAGQRPTPAGPGGPSRPRGTQRGRLTPARRARPHSRRGPLPDDVADMASLGVRRGRGQGIAHRATARRRGRQRRGHLSRTERQPRRLRATFATMVRRARSRSSPGCCPCSTDRRRTGRRRDLRRHVRPAAPPRRPPVDATAVRWPAGLRPGEARPGGADARVGRRDPGGPRSSFNAMHPGWADTPGHLRGAARVLPPMGPLLRTPAEGADTTVWLAADPAAAGGRDRTAVPRPAPTAVRPRAEDACRPAADRRRLWDVVVGLAGVTDPAPDHPRRPDHGGTT